MRSPLLAPEAARRGLCTWALAAGLLASGCEAPKIVYGNCVASCKSSVDCTNEMVCNSQGLCVSNQGVVCTPAMGTGGAAGSTGTSRETGGATASNNTLSGGSSSVSASGGTVGSGGVTAARGDTGGASTVAGAGGNASGGTTGAGAGGNNTTGGAATGGAPGSSATAGAPMGGTTGIIATGSASGGFTGGNSATGGAATGGTGSGTAVGATTGGTSTGGSGTGGTGSCGPANTPSITTQSVAAACLGQQYLAQLTATNGANYLWSARLPADSGLSLSNGGVLSGITNSAGTFAISVSVKDQVTGCASAAQQLTLTVNNTDALTCPVIKIKGKNASAIAPDSCVAWPYSAAFEVTGPNPPYTWQATQTPPGITFDSTTQTAGGNPTSSGNLVLQVVDNTGLAVQRTFAVPLRDKCWFAYISDESGATRLHLFDPLLGARLQRPTSNTTDVAVADYKFSPDGQYIAYRVTDTSQNSTLWLWKAPEWDDEQPINFGGSVTHYEWSNNGHVLAVAFEGASGTQLGGVDVSGVPANQLVDGGIQGLRLLDPVAAPVESEITWYGSDAHVVFHSPSSISTGFDFPSQANLGQTGFTGVLSRIADTYDPSMVFYPNDGGFFLMDPTESPTVLIFIPNTSNVATYHGDVAVAPSAPYVAWPLSHTLNVASATTDTFDLASTQPLVTSTGCDTILGWAAEQGRIICVDQTAGALRTHDLDLVHQSTTSSMIQNSQAYVSDTWQGYRHIVSATGNWAALSTGTNVYLANLVTPSLAQLATVGSSAVPSDMSFSPNERFLVVNTSSLLQLFGTDAATRSTTSVLASPQGCADDPLSDPNWCGRQVRPLQLSWSEDSQLLGFANIDGPLVVLDLRTFETDDSLGGPIQAVANCGSGCFGTGQFQP